MLIPDIVRHLGQYCQVTTANRQLFGELTRLSSAAFGLRLPWSGKIERVLEANEIVAITDLRDPHL